MVKVPGVSVMELARISLAIFDCRVVVALMIPGLMGREGLKTLHAISKFAFISSFIKVNRNSRVKRKAFGLSLNSSKTVQCRHISIEMARAIRAPETRYSVAVD